MNTSKDYKMLYLITLSNSNKTYVATDEQCKILSIIDNNGMEVEEIPYYVNDLEDYFECDM
jgi:hypothetical protein